MSPMSTVAEVGEVIIAMRLSAVCTNLDVHRIQYVKNDILDKFILLLIITVALLVVIVVVVVPVLVPIIPLCTPYSAVVNTRPIIILPVGVVGITVR